MGSKPNERKPRTRRRGKVFLKTKLRDENPSPTEVRSVDRDPLVIEMELCEADRRLQPRQDRRGRTTEAHTELRRSRERYTARLEPFIERFQKRKEKARHSFRPQRPHLSRFDSHEGCESKHSNSSEKLAAVSAQQRNEEKHEADDEPQYEERRQGPATERACQASPSGTAAPHHHRTTT